MYPAFARAHTIDGSPAAYVFGIGENSARFGL
jgi:hypothetical protein